MKKVVAIGADHRGFALKEDIKEYFSKNSDRINFIDIGAHSVERSDYPLFAKKAAELVVSGKAYAGILLCGTGVGVAIVANRWKGVYAGVAWNVEIARLAKEDDNVNVLCLPADYLAPEVACEIIKAWLSAEFKGGRYAERLHMIDE